MVACLRPRDSQMSPPDRAFFVSRGARPRERSGALLATDPGHGIDDVLESLEARFVCADRWRTRPSARGSASKKEEKELYKIMLALHIFFRSTADSLFLDNPLPRKHFRLRCGGAPPCPNHSLVSSACDVWHDAHRSSRVCAASRRRARCAVPKTKENRQMWPPRRRHQRQRCRPYCFFDTDTPSQSSAPASRGSWLVRPVGCSGIEYRREV